MGFKKAWAAQKQAQKEQREGSLFMLGMKVQVRNGKILHGGENYPLAGAHAAVDTAGAIDKRVTASRLILTGPLAFGLRKKTDDRELFLLVEGEGFGFVVDLDPSKQREAREFAAKLNAAASSLAPPTDTPEVIAVAPPPAFAPPVVDQIRQLAELRDQGILTSREFAAKKSELLNRL